MLGDVVRQVRDWQRAGCWQSGVYVSVNLSGGQLLDCDLADDITSQLARHGVAAEALRLELTETAVIADPGVARHVLPALRRAGIALCMDDFGTGYSSLSYLNDLPFDVLKIDRAFVSGCGDDGSRQALIRTTLAMARELAIAVVAEGIETEAEARLLRTLGCRYGQGWHFARALPPAEAAQWLSAAAGAPMQEGLA